MNPNHFQNKAKRVWRSIYIEAWQRGSLSPAVKRPSPSLISNKFSAYSIVAEALLHPNSPLGPQRKWLRPL